MNSVSNQLAIALHTLSAVVWIGGLFFAYVVLRPSAATLDPARRLGLWSAVFKRFFPWVWMTVLVLLISGYWLLFMRFGGFSSSPGYVHLMQLIGLLMMGLFVFLFHVPYKAFKQQVGAEDWQAAGAALNRIRTIVLFNLVLGMALVAWVSANRYG